MKELKNCGRNGMKKVKIAQIGTSKNSHGNNIWDTITRRTDIFEVAGYAFAEGEREKFPDQAKRFEGYKEMTVEEILADEEIEAVAVETEEIYLTKYALLCARAGKHIHMEKPGGIDLSEFEELIRELKSRGLAFSVGYMYRFNPKIREALQKVKSGALGRIYSVEANMNCSHRGEFKEWLGNFPGGMMFFLGCHLVDIIYSIQGDPSCVIPLSTYTGIGGIDTCDFGMAVFEYPGGVSFAKACCSEKGGFMRRGIVIAGEHGTIEIKPLEVVLDEGMYTVCSECFENSWHTPWRQSRSELFDRYDAMMQNFANLVRGMENPYSYDYELNLYKLILRACGKEV